jgi:hypothetical protein
MQEKGYMVDLAPDSIGWLTSLLSVYLKQNILKLHATAWECRVLGYIRIVKTGTAVVRA